MVNIRKILLGIISSLVIVLIIFYLFPNQEKKIQKKLDSLEDLVSKSQKESGATLLYKMNQFQMLFAEECEIDLTEDFAKGIFSSSELTTLCFKFRADCLSIKLYFSDKEIDLLSESMAKVKLAASLVMLLDSGEKVFETKEIVSGLRKIKKQWFFCFFKEVKIIEK